MWVAKELLEVIEQVLRIFVSSPGDVPDERRRVDLVVERLNTEFAERVRIETIRWSPAAAACLSITPP
jgi:hypothetical protein